MANELTVASASLAIALAALVIATGQLWQSLMGTVEGYRRCAPSVIGPWAKLRRRRWNWTEFRFEVEFATPHLIIEYPYTRDSVSILKTSMARPGWSCDLSLISRLEKTGPSLNLMTAVEKLLSETDIRRHLELTLERVTQVHRAYAAAILESWGHAQPSPGYKIMALDKDADWVGGNSGIQVTWLSFVEEVCHAYGASLNPPPQEPEASDVFTGSIRSVPLLSARTWNWDFMPADLLRPLATSTLNNVVLLALRLHMQWRRLDLENGIFQADGNGCSLTSTETRGLGITFQFTRTGVKDVRRNCAPSEAVDKMYFGIIPGCPRLVQRDFGLVSQERELRFERLFTDIGINDGDFRFRLASGWPQPRDEAVILLSEFLAVSGCHTLYHYFPGWSGPSITSPLHCYEGRVALVDALQERVGKLPNGTPTVLSDILSHFITLRDDWNSDFCGRWSDSTIEGYAGIRKIALAKDCKRIFQWTTKYLSGTGRGYIHWGQLHGARTLYTDLVAGHVVMAFEAATHVHAHRNDTRDDDHPDVVARRSKHEDVYGDADVGEQEMYRIGSEYVARIGHKEHGVVRHMQRRDSTLTHEAVEEAWWALMLRGVAWDMSTNGDAVHGRRLQYYWDQDFVPSSFYYIRTPVWIS